MHEFAMSNHALSRAVDMAVDADEIIDAIERPRESFWSDRTNSEWRTRGRITVCVVQDPGGQIVATTILWSKPSGWAADAEWELPEGRTMTDWSGTRAMAKARKRNRR
ncbi:MULTISPECIES: hypothetical protein [unclassified Cryobacterium]|uniref:hypothetical protein n=1 Tax=unclassified Cryobacterium TaxID=2649013 RepID=UPI00106A6E80|nr:MULTISPECIES: hypothetical protein [unclassified Cryobacterium]TFB96559.1 hypothetical protein E3O39_10840 [Cryobacterium sp. MDB2-A-1]TFC12843.1 hypothetical protein E3O35_08000 [Cryobacterium sp. MDB2-A-2]